MKMVKILRGTYGYRPKKGGVTMVGAGNPPILLADEEAERLVSLKIGEVAEDTLPSSDKEGNEDVPPPPATKGKKGKAVSSEENEGGEQELPPVIEVGEPSK